MTKKITLEDEFKKNPELKKEELEALKAWYSKQSHLPAVSDELLALFFHSCLYRAEPTKVTLDLYFTVRTHVPEFFENRDPFKVDMKNGVSVLKFFMLPGVTPNGSRVIFIKTNITDAAAFNFNECIKSFIMTSDIEHYINGTSKGFLILFDMDGISFGHLAKLNILSIKKILYYLQEAMPVRLTGLHFINVVPFMDKILAMMRPFLKKDLMENLKLHTAGIDSLFEHVPLALLPKEYGGDAASTDELNDDFVKLRQENKIYFEEEQKQRVNESVRPGKAKNAGDIFGIEGSFKKLDLD